MAIAEARVRTTPESPSGLWSWITTVDHKRIGIMYATTALFFFFVGGLEALLIRLQLTKAESTLISPELYNQLFTMHGTTMVFLVGMPIAVAFFNYLVPLQIGARDVAFPRLNALSYWVYLLGAIFISWPILVGLAPNNGWFGYAPLTSQAFSPEINTDFWTLGLQILGIASIMGGVNFITTIINLRAPGMTLMRMPLFTWMTLVTSFIIITALPVLAVALFFLTWDRFFGTNFFVASAGGQAVLWQHLFWIFGHPEVYILVLPAFGIMSDVIPAHARKPLFGYAMVVYSGVLIGFIGWGVWAHHMFATGMGPIADSFFAIATMIIAIPTGVKIFNWLATIWGGSVRFTTAMHFAIGVLAMFPMGGVSGIHHGSPPANLQQTDTYYIVAHFHYVLFGGLILGIFAGVYHWFPKASGRMLNEKLGRWNFWLIFLGSNLTFFPMHFAGLLGMPRRIFTYSAELNLDFLNQLATVGAFMTGAGALVFAYNIYHSLRKGERAGANPWNASSLEWATASPPSVYNFPYTPQVRSREPLWDHPEDFPADTGEAMEEIHLPSNSYWPLLVAVGVVGTNALFLTNTWWAPLLGVIWTIIAVLNWAFEPEFKH